MRPRRLLSGLAAALSLATMLVLAPQVGATADTLPASLSDKEFWNLSETLSEPNGFFRSDNLLSNELNLSTVAAALAARVKPGGVYLGVGPEQNFTYITAIRPKIAFITDIRRGNLHTHLMYKALFELSENRSEFVSRLFTKPLQKQVTTSASANELVNAYWDITTSDEATYQANLQAIKDLLVKKHNLPLPDQDLDGIAYVYRQFYLYGPAINYSSSTTGQWGGRTTYGDLMIATDGLSGMEWSYLATEDKFKFLKTLESRNLLVPVVGDFAGPKALRAVGAWIRDHDAVVTAFYLSNVEQYLRSGGVHGLFCANVATMPLDEQSSFIRPMGGGGAMNVIANRPTAATPPAGRAGTVVVSQPQPLSFIVLPAGGRGGSASSFGEMAAEVKACSGG